MSFLTVYKQSTSAAGILATTKEKVTRFHLFEAHFILDSLFKFSAKSVKFYGGYGKKYIGAFFMPPSVILSQYMVDI